MRRLPGDPVKSRGADDWVGWVEDGDAFKPVTAVRDIVFRCRGCGALNEVPNGVGQSGEAIQLSRTDRAYEFGDKVLTGVLKVLFWP